MSPLTSSEHPRRLALRPGVPVVRRDDHHLQVGVDPPGRVVLRDDADVRRTLEDLLAGRAPAPRTVAGERLLVELSRARLVVDGTQLDAALAGFVDRDRVRSAFAQHGDEAPARLQSRSAARVEVDVPPPVRELTTRLLRASGVRLSGEGDVGADDAPTVSLGMTVGEVCRDRLDDAVRDGHPHLVVCAGSTSITLGPFVVPGRTACLRCADAQRAELDPRRAIVVEQCARQSRAAQPLDPALLTLAAAWAVRDLVSFVDGDRPSTWSASITLRPGLVVDRQEWKRHPGCGCAWDLGLAAAQG